MIRHDAFAFAKHLHFAKDAKRQWDRDTRHMDREHTHSLSCPAVMVVAGAARRQQCRVRWRCDENCVQSAVLCCESLLLQARIRMGDVFLQSEGHQDRELS